MINAKMYDFYGVVLSSVEVVLKLRAVGAIAPFFSLEPNTHKLNGFLLIILIFAPLISPV